MRFRGDPESREQARVVKLFRLAGCQVYATSRQRAQGCAGLPDLYVMHQFGGDWWFEVKAPGGKQNAEQKRFQEYVEQCGGAEYVIGGYDEAVRFLEFRRVIVPQTKRTA